MCSRTLGNWYKNIPSSSPPIPLLGGVRGGLPPTFCFA
ncbi:hypothetical protein CWATWH8502_1770 [Crocosphaera watsonii WH 8502]|uniref:Uncharacterized protein n=1 Tax=Crocosphaera watsonii WH 8502 TaxID=423474 RepID=T2IF63_CROWT|nr:hypothetical protein CWATWH8502_1770 [Crocosphaera watsonii WH 8502]